MMAMAMKDILVFNGVRDVAIARDLKEAIAALMLRPWDVLFTDWAPNTRPDYQLAVRVRQGDFDIDRYMSVIVTCSGVTPELVQSARDAGANEIMIKPITGAAMRDKLITIVENPREFVESKSFFGPDRRRQRVNSKGYNGSDRRQR